MKSVETFVGKLKIGIKWAQRKLEDPQSRLAKKKAARETREDDLLTSWLQGGEETDLTGIGSKIIIHSSSDIELRPKPIEVFTRNKHGLTSEVES